MSTRQKAIVLILLLVASAGFAEVKPVHVFILSGQSNMAHMQLEAGFLPEAEKLFEGDEVVYIKVAKGGQPICLWVEEWRAIAKKHKIDPKGIQRTYKAAESTLYYKPILEQYQALLEKHPKPASVTLCWMQGERDASGKFSAAYADAMKQLIANLRRDLKQPDMNVVIDRIGDFELDERPHWQGGRKAQIDVANADPCGAWVDCDDLNNKEKNAEIGNSVHYTKEGYELLGRRFARQAKALVNGKKPAANGRPE